MDNGGEGGKIASGNAYVVNVETGIVRNLTKDLDVDLGRSYKPRSGQQKAMQSSNVYAGGTHSSRINTPFEQAQEMFIGLAHLKKEVVLLKYKEADHWHGFWSNEKLADYWERVLKWFDEYLK